MSKYEVVFPNNERVELKNSLKYDGIVEGNTHLKPMIEQEDVDSIIKQLQDTRFSNEQTRKYFVNLIVQLASMPDKKARKVIKGMGDFMSDYTTEITNDSSSTMEAPEENEATIINLDKAPNDIIDSEDEYMEKVKQRVEKSRNTPKYYVRRFD